MLLRNGNRYTQIKDIDGDPDYEGAASRLVSREYGFDHFAHRAVGWDKLPREFTAEVCRSVGDLTEHVSRETFEISS